MIESSSSKSISSDLVNTTNGSGNLIAIILFRHIISQLRSHLGQSLHVGVSGEGLGNSGDPRFDVVEFVGPGSVVFVLPDTSFLCFFCNFFFSPAFPDSVLSIVVTGIADELERLLLSLCRV